MSFIAVLLSGYEREERRLRLDSPLAAALDEIRLMSNGIGGAPPEILFALGHPYQDNAFGLSQGKRKMRVLPGAKSTAYGIKVGRWDRCCAAGR